MWSALLGACQKWASLDLGRWAFDKLVQLDEDYDDDDGGGGGGGENVVALISVSNMYSMQEDRSES
jgi:hypothetical protein